MDLGRVPGLIWRRGRRALASGAVAAETRNDSPAVLPEIAKINAEIATLADGKAIRYVNINDTLADSDGTLHEGMSSDGMHLGLKGY